MRAVDPRGLARTAAVYASAGTLTSPASRGTVHRLAPPAPAPKRATPTPSPVAATPAKAAAPVKAAPKVTVTAADQKEYKLLTAKKSIRTAKKKPITSVTQYVTYRNGFFGSAAKYQAAKVKADTEFNAMPRGARIRIGQREPKATKRVLYRWVRQAYLNHGISNPATVITTGPKPALLKKLAAIKKAHPGLPARRFIPMLVSRPKKYKGNYRLGTLSKHAVGKAVDLWPQRANPHLGGGDWAFVQKVTGISVNNSLKRWKTSPGALWQDIHDLNAAYELWLKKQVAALVAAHKASGKKPPKSPIRAVLKGHGALITAAKEHPVGHGFFDLKKSVVLDFAKQGLRWGATFGRHPDLHHFEL